MKFILLTTFLFSASLLIASCGQNTNKGKLKSAEDTLSTKPHYIIDTLDIRREYIVKTDKSYFFEHPDSLSKRIDFLVKGGFLQISAISNDFGYAIHPVSSDSNLAGWVFLNTLEPIFFTPPKGAIIDSTK